MIDKDLKHKLVLAHGGLMVFAWLVAVPLAIGANMYARKKNKTWGTKVHMIVMATIAFLPFTISGIIAFTVAGKISFRPHSGIGTILTMGAWIQVLIGVINHGIFRYRLKNNCLPNSRPWNNYVHIWFGRALSLLALINIPLGMRIKKASLALYIVYGIWIALLGIMFLYLTWMKQEGVKLDIQEEITKKDYEDKEEYSPITTAAAVRNE